jgi:superfamily II DNA or RNA helicase
MRPYQQPELSNGLTNQRRGTLKMATGSSSAITTLEIKVQLYQTIQLQALVVVHPQGLWKATSERSGQRQFQCANFDCSGKVGEYKKLSLSQGEKM